MEDIFLWLTDDDWIDTDSIEKCVTFLEDNSDYSLCCGLCNYQLKENTILHKDSSISIEDDDKLKRLLVYYSTVSLNGYFLGYLEKIFLINLLYLMKLDLIGV